MVHVGDRHCSGSTTESDVGASRKRRGISALVAGASADVRYPLAGRSRGLTASVMRGRCWYRTERRWSPRCHAPLARPTRGRLRDDRGAGAPQRVKPLRSLMTRRSHHPFGSDESTRHFSTTSTRHGSDLS